MPDFYTVTIRVHPRGASSWKNKAALSVWVYAGPHGCESDAVAKAAALIVTEYGLEVDQVVSVEKDHA